MKLSRRDFIHAGCAIAAITLTSSFFDRAEAWVHGVAPSVTNANRVTVNVPGGGVGFMNLAKAWQPSNAGQPLPPSLIDANGNPSGVVPSNYSSGISLVPNFYDQYAWAWTGLGGMQFIGAVAFVYSGGAAVVGLTQGGGPAGTGYVTGNFT